MNELTERIIGAVIEVHRALGPGLLESAYEHCLHLELTSRGARSERPKAFAESLGFADWGRDRLIAGLWQPRRDRRHGEGGSAPGPRN